MAGPRGLAPGCLALLGLALGCDGGAGSASGRDVGPHGDGAAGDAVTPGRDDAAGRDAAPADRDDAAPEQDAGDRDVELEPDLDPALDGGVGEPDGGAPGAPCTVDQPDPYLDSPDPGIHGNGGKNERIPCPGPAARPAPGWSASAGSLIFNPITVGRGRLNAVVARAGRDACRLWTVDLTGTATPPV